MRDVYVLSDLVMKALAAACTLLLAIAVSSLNSMNSEIKDLAKSVNELTVSSTVVIQSQKSIEHRLQKIEAEAETIRTRLRVIELLKKEK